MGRPWHEIAIIAEEGMAFGVVESGDGKLVLICSVDGRGGWPHGVRPDPDSVNVIATGYSRYMVTVDPDSDAGEAGAAGADAETQ